MQETRNVGLIPGSGRSPRGGNGKPLRHSCLNNPMDRGAWQSTIHRITKSGRQLKQLSMQSPLYFSGVSCNFFFISDFTDLGSLFSWWVWLKDHQLCSSQKTSSFTLIFFCCVFNLYVIYLNTINHRNKFHGLCIPWNSPAQNTGMGHLCLIQGIFPTQVLNPGLSHCKQILYQGSH